MSNCHGCGEGTQLFVLGRPLCVKCDDATAPGREGQRRTGTVTRVPFDGEQKQDFSVFLTARNGAWVELLRMRKVSGTWRKAIRVDEDNLFGKLKQSAATF
jgi:hypothetical protein